MKRDKYIISIFVGEERYLSREGQMKLIQATVRKIGYYLSVAYYDIAFRTVFSILVLKLFLFDYLIHLGIFSMSCFADFGVILVFLAPSLLLKNRMMKFGYLFFLDLVFSLIFFSNSLFHHYFRDFASLFDIYQAKHLMTVSDAVIKLIHSEVLFLFDLLVLPFFFWKDRDKYDFTFASKIKAFVVLLVLGLYCNGSMLLHSRTIVTRYAVTIGHRSYLAELGIINYQILDMYTFLGTEGKRLTLSPADISYTEAWLEARREKKYPSDQLTGSGKGDSVIVIQAESLQNWLVGAKYLGREITPHLNRLVKRAIYFDNIYDQAWDGNSSDAPLLANSSLYPASRGAAAFLYAENYFDTLPKVLEEHGYETAAMHANVRTFWNSDVFEKSLGFEHQYYKRDFLPGEVIGLGLSDRAFFSQDLEKIKALHRPFYVFLRTLTTHFPFAYITNDIDEFFLGNLEGTLIGGYIRSMNYLYSAIGDFLQQLAKADLLSKTIIVVYGDHRTRLSESDLWQAGITDMREKNKIPLIISIPGRTQQEVRHTIGGLVDVTPTLCNILGVDISGKFFLGKNLGRSGQGYAIFRDGSFISPAETIDGAGAEEELRLNDLILEKNVLGVLKGKREQDFVNTREASFD
jgi:lipoteichoic acid synthase